MWRKLLILILPLMLGVSVFGRTGAWVDELVVTTETDMDKAIQILALGDADVYFYNIDKAELYKKIVEDPNLYAIKAYGLYRELTFNPYPADPSVSVKEFKDGRLNPFAVPKIREAMNWLIDRDYVAEELAQGLAVPRYLPLTPTFPPYTEVLEKVRELENKYAHNPEKAKEVIFAEMEKLGAELVDGKWYYKGQPVTIIVLIRTEDWRKQLGDYVAGLLEELGFTVDRRYGVSRDLSKCWIFTDPAEGCFHIYTGGWITTAIDRNEGDNFDFFYTKRGWSPPLWQAYYVKPEADEVFKKLANRDYSSMEERRELLEKALEFALENSVRVWVAHDVGIYALRKGIQVAADLAGGVPGADLWPFTLRRVDSETGEIIEGGTIRILNGAMFNEPWNPVAGSNWIYDTTLTRATGLPAVVSDPFTGLYHPERLTKAEVYVQEGLPVRKTLDWVTLEFVDEIKVPNDAWIDWDAKEQRFVTVEEKYPEGLTARAKVVVHYDPQTFKDLWHDGSQFSIADILLAWILGFDRAKEESAIFDESTVPDFQAFMEYFRGIKINYNPENKDDPLVVEYYTDSFELDAEWLATYGALDALYEDRWPGAWHAVAIGILAEAAKEAAFSSDKADNLGIEWMNYVAGPTVEVLKKYLDKAIEEAYIPYEPVLGQYVTKEEAVARYQNLLNWFNEKGHFWVGNGPFYLDSADTVAGTVVLKRFEEFADPADKWLRFAEPKIAKIDFLGAPEVLEIGAGAVIPVNITFKEEPYPPDEINFVKYLLFDAEGNLISIGEAEYFGGPTWNVVLTPEITSKLTEGTAKLEVAVSSKVVAIPSFSSITFVVVP